MFLALHNLRGNSNRWKTGDSRILGQQRVTKNQVRNLLLQTAGHRRVIHGTKKPSNDAEGRRGRRYLSWTKTSELGYKSGSVCRCGIGV